MSGQLVAVVEPGTTLFDRLPSVHRRRDAEQLAEPLRALVQVLEGQSDSLATQIEGQYDDWFIETCGDALLPFFAELVGVAPARPVGANATAEVAAIDAAWRRRQVADAFLDRRRRGTVGLVAELARAASGWPAVALELSKVALVTASARFPGLGAARAPHAQADCGSQALEPPFSTLARLACVGAPSRARQSASRPSSTALWLWRQVPLERKRQRARPLPDRRHEQPGRPARYRIDALGRDVQLCTVPVEGFPVSVPPVASALAVPITRDMLAAQIEELYGEDKSLRVYRIVRERVPGSTVPQLEERLVPPGQILVRDLSAGHVAVPSGHVAIDPELGRVALAHDLDAEHVTTSHARLTMGDIGAGAADRDAPCASSSDEIALPEAITYPVGRRDGEFRDIHHAIAAWARERVEHPSAVIEIADDRLYCEQLRVELSRGERLVIRAACGCSPVIDAGEGKLHSSVDLRHPRATIEIARERHPHQQSRRHQPARAKHDDGPDPQFVLEGVSVLGAAVELRGSFSAVILRYCTLAGASSGDVAPALELLADTQAVRIELSVLGAVQGGGPGQGENDPTSLLVRDSILGEIRCRERGQAAWISLTCERATVFGPLDVHEIVLIEDAILTAHVCCERRQVGEVRNSYLPPQSHTPRRFDCLPDLALARLDGQLARGERDPAEAKRLRQNEQARLVPRFDSIRLGEATYGRLAQTSALELRNGASDGGELGAHHRLWEPHRIESVRRALGELAPVGTDIDIVLAS
jgi:hypothetical protein